MVTSADRASNAVVLQMGPTASWLSESLRSTYEVVVMPDDDAARRRLLTEDATWITVLVVSGRVPVDDSLIAALPGLGLIANLGVGYDNVDTRAARRRGVIVTNTPDVLTDAVAELTVGLLLATVRRIVAADRYVRAGRWANEGPFPLTGQLSGQRVGILGLGRVGRAVAERLEPFGCAISYHSRRQVAGVTHLYLPSPTELAASVDVLVVTVPAGPETQAIVDRPVLESLGSGGVLVNVARGSVVDQEALVELLVAERIGGAGLDVYADEPRVPEALTELDSVVLLPHVGSATTTTRHAMADLLLRNVAAFLEDGTVLTPV